MKKDLRDGNLVFDTLVELNLGNVWRLVDVVTDLIVTKS